MAGIYGVSVVNEIIPNLYLTSVYGATKENILKKGITLLVNAAQELPKQELPGVESIKLFLDDTPYANIGVYFDRIADKIHEHISGRGGRVMVHCVLGVSRSTSLVIAYLMKYRGMSMKSGFDLVSSRRPCVRPNPGFWRQLADYEKGLQSKPAAASQTYATPSSSYSSSSLSSGHSHNNHNSNNAYKKDTHSIPIQILSTSSSSRTKPQSSSSSSNFLSSSNHNHNHNHDHNHNHNHHQNHYNTLGSSTSHSIPVYHEYNSSYNTRPYSASRFTFDRDNYSNGSHYSAATNGNGLSKSTSYGKGLEKKDFDDQFVITTMPSSSLATTRYLTSNPSPGQHRTTFLVNDDPIGKKSSNFATTYRTSYGRY